jgi:hypothetical protein
MMMNEMSNRNKLHHAYGCIKSSGLIDTRLDLQLWIACCPSELTAPCQKMGGSRKVDSLSIAL